jgi:hypothetical protein
MGVNACLDFTTALNVNINTQSISYNAFEQKQQRPSNQAIKQLQPSDPEYLNVPDDWYKNEPERGLARGPK